jgi:hypothetical protein
MQMPVLPSQSHIVLSYDAEASLDPLAENVTDVIESEWPLRMAAQRPVLASHSRAVASFEPEASLEPSTENVTDLTVSRVAFQSGHVHASSAIPQLDCSVVGKWRDLRAIQ